MCKRLNSLFYRDYRNTYWSQPVYNRLSDVTCSCAATIDQTAWNADRWQMSEANSRGRSYLDQLYSPSVGHHLIAIVKQALAGSTSGNRWGGLEGGARGEGVGSITLAGCSSPTRLALDMDELWESSSR
jgi:hypothetical protein